MRLLLGQRAKTGPSLPWIHNCSATYMLQAISTLKVYMYVKCVLNNGITISCAKQSNKPWQPTIVRTYFESLCGCEVRYELVGVAIVRGQVGITGCDVTDVSFRRLVLGHVEHVLILCEHGAIIVDVGYLDNNLRRPSQRFGCSVVYCFDLGPHT